ncbi:hypothetical protein JOC77_002132 [Peribacillus deserti]|uniref:Uncharacterized protein n=1 Tax=Peribacillus deserti TaxID=673318 RepID=A0ABS2QHQ3_9BACI|nr:hypothetical protein [Peribacillus deserti]
MEMLTRNKFEKSASFIKANARPLDASLFNTILKEAVQNM